MISDSQNIYLKRCAESYEKLSDLIKPFVYYFFTN